MWQTSRDRVAKHPCWVQWFLQIQQKFPRLLRSPIRDILQWLISVDQTETSYAVKLKTTHRIRFKESSGEHCRRHNHRSVICHRLKDGRKDWEEIGRKRESKRGETSVGGTKAINHSYSLTHAHMHLPVAAAVFCRACWQDDSTGHQHLQQNHQDEVKVDLRESTDTAAEGRLTKGSREKCFTLLCLCGTAGWLVVFIMLLWWIYIDSRRVQDQFTSKPNQAGGRHSKRWHVDHLEIWHLEKNKKTWDLH